MSRSSRLRALISVIGVLLVVVARPVEPAGAEPIGVLAAATAIALDPQSSPSDGQTVAVSPEVLTLVFTTPLAAAPGVVIQTAENAPVAAVGSIARGDDATIWLVELSAPLPADTYRVTWTADGQSASYSFTVGAAAGETAATDATATTIAGAAVTTATDPAAATSSPTVDTGTAEAVNLIARWLSYLAIAALVGGLVLIAVAWGDGVEYVLTVRFLRISWGLAIVGTVVNLAATRAVFEGASLGSSLSPGSWGDLTDNAAGLGLLARFVLLLATGWVIAGPERAVDEATQIPALLPPLLAVATFAFTRADSGVDLFLTVAGVIHALAFAVWFGGLALLWRVVLAGSGERDLVDAVRGFSRIATPALLGILLSGVVLTAKLVGGASELLGSGYGRLLLLKAIGVAAMAYAGVINRQTVQQRLNRLEHLPGRTAIRLRRAIGTEMLAGVVVLGLTAWMVGFAPQGLPDQVVRDHTKPATTTPIGNDDISLDIGVGPARAGLNDVTIDVLEPAQGLVALTLRFDPLDAYVESVVISVTPTLTGRGQMIVDDVPFNAAGRWSITATGDNTKGKIGESQATIVINAVDGSTASTTAATPTTAAAGAAATLALATTAAPTGG